MSQSYPDYAELNQLLQQHQILNEAAEIHGVIAGQLCGGQVMDNRSWQPVVYDLCNNGEAFPLAVMRSLDHLYQQTCQALISGDLAFEIFLPSDDEGLELRVEALASWVQGFLAGLAVVQKDIRSGSDELNECLRDLSDIAQISMTEEDEPEEAESAMVELHEYVRVAAMMAFAEWGQRQQVQDDTVH